MITLSPSACSACAHDIDRYSSLKMPFDRPQVAWRQRLARSTRESSEMSGEFENRELLVFKHTPVMHSVLHSAHMSCLVTMAAPFT